MKRTAAFLVATVWSFALCNGQQAFSVSGGDAGGTGGKTSFTVGLTDNDPLPGETWMAALGVQYPFEIIVVTGFEPPAEVLIDCIIYPNPVSQSLLLKISRELPEGFSYQLTDLDGRLVKEGKISAAETRISMSRYRSSTYFLHVLSNSTDIKVFKIIKTDQP